MMRSLFGKILYDKRWFVMGWSIGLAVMIYFVVLVFPSFRDTSFDELAKNLPSQLQGLVGDTSTFNTLSGYIGTQLYDIRIPLFIMVLTIILALSLTVREEEKGTMRTLLATSLGRIRIVFESWAAMIFIMTIVSVVAMAATLAGIWSIGETVSILYILKLGFLTAIFGVTVASIPMAVGFATGKRALTTSVAVTVTIGSFLLSSFAMSIEALKAWEVLSLLYYFDAGQIATDGLSGQHVFILVGIVVASLLTASFAFSGRDVSGS